MSVTAPSTKRKLAPVAVRSGRRILFSLPELAELMDVEEGVVRNALTKERDAFFPHAFTDAQGQWWVPVEDARRLLGRPLEQLFTIRRFAELIGYSYHETFRNVSAGRIKAEIVLGNKRVPESEYWKLRGKRVPVRLEGGTAA